MTKRIAVAIGFSLLAIATSARAESEYGQSLSPTVETEPNDRLLIVNGNTGRVIYDDGRNDLFCVTRTRVVGYNHWGQPIRQRNMRCR